MQSPVIVVSQSGTVYILENWIYPKSLQFYIHSFDSFAFSFALNCPSGDSLKLSGRWVIILVARCFQWLLARQSALHVWCYVSGHLAVASYRRG